MNSQFAGVEGRVLTGVAISKDGETTLRLSFAEGDPHFVETDGDCCSESWWADVIGAASCYGGTVTQVRTLDLPEPQDDRSRQEEDQAYGYAIDTERGTVTLAFRNSSNGYYGGSAYATTDPCLSELRWTEIDSNSWAA